MSFWSDALPYAQQVHSATGVLTSVLLSQAADEQAYRWPPNGNNIANVGSFDGQPINVFPSIEAGTLAWAQTMNMPDYAAVRAAIGWRLQAIELGYSPWATSHYNNGGGPGSVLVEIIQENDLTQYDSTSEGPVLSAPIISVIAPPQGGGYWLIARDGGVFSFPSTLPFYGSMGGKPLTRPIVDAVVSPTGLGYCLVGSDGGTFEFGDFANHGSIPGDGIGPAPEQDYPI